MIFRSGDADYNAANPGYVAAVAAPIISMGDFYLPVHSVDGVSTDASQLIYVPAGEQVPPQHEKFVQGTGWDDDLGIGDTLDKVAPLAAGLFLGAGVGAFLGPLLSGIGASATAAKGVASLVATRIKTAVVSPLLPTVKPIAPQLTSTRKTPMFDEEMSTGILSGIDWGQVGSSLLQVALNQANNQQTSQLLLPAAAQTVALPGLGAIAGGAGRLLGLTGIGAAGAAAVGILRSAGGRILGWILPTGTKVTRKAAVELAKKVGLSTAAGAIGASAVELAEAIMQEEGRPHRRRGISAAQLRTTTRTIGAVERMHKRIAKAARAHHR